VIGFYETLKVRACEARTDFPARVDWDTFFRDAKTMNELLPGQRPDTIYLANLPVKWFADEKVVVDVGELLLPSETVFRLVMEKFGEVRCVDIPLCDPYRKDMSRTGIRSVGFSFGRELVFEGYVQYVEYISFLKAMDQLRNMRLVKFDENGKAHQAQIKVSH
jgi:arginine/serine-rich splicing factor 17